MSDSEVILSTDILTGADAGTLRLDEFQKAIFRALLAGWNYVEVEGRFYCPTCTRKYGRPIELDKQSPSIFGQNPKPHNCLHCGSEDVELTISLTMKVQRDAQP